jgi:release factor glutamine methyltransferase
MLFPECTLAEAVAILLKALPPSIDDREKRNITTIFFCHFLGLRRADIVLKGQEVLSPESISQISPAMIRLVSGEPVQYITGKVEFAGISLEVNPSVLIPRPETEELVSLIAARMQPGEALLDIGTGSGCIAIALKGATPSIYGEAWDIDEKALETARSNAERNGLKITFRKVDIRKPSFTDIRPFDWIVSNPPYIPQSESQSMSPQVLRYEPQLALFCPDEDPLLYYRAVARFALYGMDKQGELWFEIHPPFAGELTEMLVSMGFLRCEVYEDMQGRNRFMRARF